MKKNAIKEIIKEYLNEDNMGEVYFSELYDNAPNKKFVDNILTYLRNKPPKDVELLVNFAIDEIKKDIPDWNINDWYLFNDYVHNMQYFDANKKSGIEKDLY